MIIGLLCQKNIGMNIINILYYHSMCFINQTSNFNKIELGIKLLFIELDVLNILIDTLFLKIMKLYIFDLLIYIIFEN